MKKTYVIGMALMGSLAFCACTGNQSAGDGLGEGAEQEITLAVANGNSTSTRAGRPLLSSEAKQNIDKVIVYVVDASTKEVKHTEEVTNWQSSSEEYGTNDGRFTSFVLDTKLPTGDYQLFAVGYQSQGSSYGDIESALVSGSTFQENAVLPLTADGPAEEIFAGSTESFHVDQAKGFKQRVVLNRQVAGVYVYAKEVPFIAGATELRLVASNENNRLVLGQFVNLELDNNGFGNSIQTAVVNGYSQESAFDKTLVKIDLNEWFTAIEDTDGNGLIDTGVEYANWKKPGFSETATFEKGSVFGGAFVIPFAKVGEEQTLKLQLTTAGGSEVKREWNVNLPSTETNTYTLYTWNGASFGEGESVTEDAHHYNIVRNHLYGLGSRTMDDPGTGTDPEPGIDEDDDPISLNNKHELELIVNDNWEAIHDMELD
ncbi:MAG TPA: hypothetical protein H9816_00770 [Candidatus Tidjanibacter faecipullorum]|uniref:Major fimbrial subunit protein N-terminal domain-containing protein n=1 Tax=Candidatus Tidjanibacter faecipullorum TaxID=2838766 RepID=A0A9D2DC86_9BACT|nr:hypothetical protein [Candidatus Tidjanibacter faecipullorum]